MPKRIRKDYPKEVKLAVVFLMKNGKLPHKEIYELFGGLDRQTAHRWVKEYDREGEAAFDEKKAVLPAHEVYQLQKENANLRMENEILKKASAYFVAKKTTM